MECRTRTCPEQFMALVEFMERYGDLSRPAPGLQGRINSQRLWEELASNLNSITSGGCKTTDKWKKVWADWKTKTKKKFLRIRRHQLQTGETQGKQSLTSLEERLIIMMGVAAMGDRPGLPDQDDNTPTEETVDQNSFNGYSSDATSPDNGDPLAQSPSSPPAPSNPSRRVGSLRDSLPRVRRNRRKIMLDRAASKFVSFEHRRIEFEESRDRRLHEREMERLRLESQRTEVARDHNQLLRQLVAIAESVLAVLSRPPAAE